MSKHNDCRTRIEQRMDEVKIFSCPGVNIDQIYRDDWYEISKHHKPFCCNPDFEQEFPNPRRIRDDGKR